MTRSRRLAVLVVMLALIAPWGASAAEPKTEPGANQALAGLWGWLTRLWAENGCLIDPSGCAGAQGDNGCIADPGGCADTQIDNGCIIDPDGCADTQIDNGCILDPDGGACRDQS